jgi:hypothetical protein
LVQSDYTLKMDAEGTMDWLSRIYSGGWEAALLDLLDNAVKLLARLLCPAG